MIFFYLCLFVIGTSAEVLENISAQERLLRFKNLGYTERKEYENNHIGVLLRNPDDNDIERPCQIFDTFCIRKFFAEHSRCKPVYGPVPDPLYRAQSTFYTPRFNLTLNGLDIFYRGLNGRVEEFYINRRTDKLVLAVDFRNFAYLSNTTYFRIHRVGQEPIENVDFFNLFYASMSQTIIIPNLKNLLFEDSEVFTFTTDPLPIFSYGLNAFSGFDLQAPASGVGVVQDLPLNSQEGFILEATYYIQSFIQYSLCDFGLLLT